MKRKLKSRHNRLKTKLGLPDLEQAKIAVIERPRCNAEGSASKMRNSLHALAPVPAAGSDDS
jgi:hypothetical protein